MGRCERPARAKKGPRGTRSEVTAYKRRARIISTAVALIIFFSLIAAGSYYLLDYTGGPKPAADETEQSVKQNSRGGILKAVLIDSLFSSHPNIEFTEMVDKTLREAGYGVDVYQGSDVTVGFLKSLAAGYKLIILRMHSALSATGELYLFTAEPFSAGKYAEEQYFTLVKEAYPTEASQSVFAVNWGFVKRLMAGKFNGSLVIVMGCDGACDRLMIEEFLDQGAVGYAGWNGSVLLSHSDRAVQRLVQALYSEKLPLEAASVETDKQVGPDPNSGAALKSFAS